MSRRLAAILAAFAFTVMLAAPVLANELHNGAGTNSEAIPADLQGSGDDCTGVQAGTVLWHFVHTKTSSSDLPSTLTATFQNNTTLATFTDTVSGFVHGSSIVMYDITTTTNVTLISASDTIVNDGLLNLSHVCNGGPPPITPEAPATVLLVLTAGLAGLGFLAWRLRRGRVAA